MLQGRTDVRTSDIIRLSVLIFIWKLVWKGKVVRLKHHAKKTGEVDEKLLHALLTSSLHGDEWLFSCFGRFTPRKQLTVSTA
jgi:hypothetical protein